MAYQAIALVRAAGSVARVLHRRSSKDVIARKIGARIRALRLEAGLTQAALAEACNSTQNYIARIEAGLKSPTLPMMATVARGLHVTLADVTAIDSRNARLQWLDAARRGDEGAMERAARRVVTTLRAPRRIRSPHS
jgi:transcriptional regulator with XRE-family HTH domain